MVSPTCVPVAPDDVSVRVPPPPDDGNFVLIMFVLPHVVVVRDAGKTCQFPNRVGVQPNAPPPVNGTLFVKVNVSITPQSWGRKPSVEPPVALPVYVKFWHENIGACAGQPLKIDAEFGGDPVKLTVSFGAGCGATKSPLVVHAPVGNPPASLV